MSVVPFLPPVSEARTALSRPLALPSQTHEGSPRRAPVFRAVAVALVLELIAGASIFGAWELFRHLRP